MGRLPDGFDQFGNPLGRAFDLGGGDEDRVRGEKILFYVCSIPTARLAEAEMRQVMAERGLQLDIRHAPANGECDLSEGLLSGYTQLWYLSSNKKTLSGQQVQMIAKYVRDGNGLAIWADNEPYYADANLLAGALMRTKFSGDKLGDRVMVPGRERTRGHFIEHQLTQGVNNLYEGRTICTIEPGPGVLILGQSHDGQLCLGCFEREGQRIVLDTGFTKLFTEFFHRSAGLGRYLSNIAFWLARGSRAVEYQLLTPGREQIATISNGETSTGYQFAIERPAALTCLLQWDGQATLGLTLRAPNGTVAGHRVSPQSPVRVPLNADTPGTWVAQVDGVDVPSARIPYVLTLAHATGLQAARPAEERLVLPFYLICETSAATTGTVSELNAALHQIQQDLLSNPLLNDSVMFSVIPFNDSAHTAVALAAPSTITIPTLQASGGTSYDAALREYHRAFESDRARLKAQGIRLSRPCVFFLAQGEPADAGYTRTFQSLLGYDPDSYQGNRAYPNVVPIGLPGVSERALAALAYPDFGDLAKRGRWFLAEPETSVTLAFRSAVAVIWQTVTGVHATASRGTPAFVPPTSIPATRMGIARQSR